MIKNADMSEEVQADAIDCATQVGEKTSRASRGRPHLLLRRAGGGRALLLMLYDWTSIQLPRCPAYVRQHVFSALRYPSSLRSRM